MSQYTMTVEEAAEALGISRSLAYEAVRTGQIPSVRVGTRILIPRAMIEQWLAGAWGKGPLKAVADSNSPLPQSGGEGRNMAFSRGLFHGLVQTPNSSIAAICPPSREKMTLGTKTPISGQLPPLHADNWQPGRRLIHHRIQLSAATRRPDGSSFKGRERSGSTLLGQGAEGSASRAQETPIS